MIYRQGAIEGLFRQAMAQKGLTVKHNTIPTAMEVAQNSKELQDPKAYATKASAYMGSVRFNLDCLMTSGGEQVTLKNLETGVVEIVHAKFLLGSDGA